MRSVSSSYGLQWQAGTTTGCSSGKWKSCSGLSKGVVGLRLRPEPKCQKGRDRLARAAAQGWVFAQSAGAPHPPSEGQILPRRKGAGLCSGARLCTHVHCSTFWASCAGGDPLPRFYGKHLHENTHVHLQVGTALSRFSTGCWTMSLEQGINAFISHFAMANG